MSGEVQTQQRRGIKSNIAIIVLLAFIFLMLSAASFFSYSVLSDSRIYKGITVDGMHLGGLTKQEAYDKLAESFKDKLANSKITITTGNVSKELAYQDIKASYNIAQATDDAYAAARTGNIFSRLYHVFTAETQGKNIELKVTYDKNGLEAAASGFYNATLVNVKEPEVLVTDEKVTINSGHQGKSIDKSALIKTLEELVSIGKTGAAEPKLEITEQGKLNIDDLYAQINRKAIDASFSIKNNIVTVIPHVTGRSLNKSVLADAVNTVMKKEDSEITIPISSVTPELTTDMAQAQLFENTLASSRSHFSISGENNKNRGENIRLAVSKINGKVLAPGEIFSFNQTVGQRTESGGFKVAHTYSGGKIVNGVGGGICQVSSTLYNSVLLSDLDVTERHNHMFIVHYVPYGTDATVSFGGPDFKFKNSTRFPLKLQAWVTSNNYVNFALIGTKEDPGKSVVITPKIIKTINFSVKYINDPSLPAGTTRIKQSGMKGYVVETYKTVKQNGVVISNVKLHTSNYKPLAQEVRRGTKKVSPATTAAPVTKAPTTPTTPATPTVDGVDDADNPPAD